jgi:lipoprotein-anchoring transpeptidase ErfK/SrfK
MSPRARIRPTVAVAVAVLALLLAGACGSSSTPGAGFALSADQLRQGAPDEGPASDWRVYVATAKPDVSEVVAYREKPPEVQADYTAPDPATLPGAHLSEIPGSAANVTSTQVLGGWSFTNPTFFDNPLVFLITEDHGDWLRVMVPTRPNQQEGWIKRSDVDVTDHEWHSEINVTTNTLRIWNGDQLVADTGTVDGRAGSPTPLGRFYYNEKIEKFPSSAYGSWIFSTNGYSDSLEVFDDGLPVFAVHGTSNPGQIGSDISNGCVRVPNEVIELMAEQVPMGTPVDVVA